MAGQGKVLEILNKSKEPLSAMEVSIKLNINPSTANQLLRTLFRHKEIKRKKIKKPIKTRVAGGVVLVIKRRCYIYYLE